jgi:imidazole glycerol phosphate synthase glutamine amidotransferase subunit
MTSVVVFDYGFGNVRSMVRALANLDLDVTLTSDHRQALEADGLVVPGVGAFGACMEGLKSVGGDRVIKDRLRAGRPVLGVCVGEQIMFERGMEHGDGTPGLGLIKGDVELLDADVVPHMGWDTVEAPEGSVLLKGVEDERFFRALLCRDERFACRHLRRPAGLRRRGRACDMVHLRAQPIRGRLRTWTVVRHAVPSGEIRRSRRAAAA